MECKEMVVIFYTLGFFFIVKQQEINHSSEKKVDEQVSVNAIPSSENRNYS